MQQAVSIFGVPKYFVACHWFAIPTLQRQSFIRPQYKYGIYTGVMGLLLYSMVVKKYQFSWQMFSKIQLYPSTLKPLPDCHSMIVGCASPRTHSYAEARVRPARLLCLDIDDCMSWFFVVSCEWFCNAHAVPVCRSVLIVVRLYKTFISVGILTLHVSPRRNSHSHNPKKKVIELTIKQIFL